MRGGGGRAGAAGPRGKAEVLLQALLVFLSPATAFGTQDPNSESAAGELCPSPPRLVLGALFRQTQTSRGGQGQPDLRVFPWWVSTACDL